MEPEGQWRCPKLGTKISLIENKNKNKNNNNSRFNNNILKKQTSNKTSGTQFFVVQKEDILLWRFAEPAVEGFTESFARFAICDVAIVLALALSSVIGQATGDCNVLGVLMLISVAVHTFLSIFYRPDQERLLKILIPAMGVIQIVLLGCALGRVEAGALYEALAMILVVSQMLLSAVWLLSTILSIFAFAKQHFGGDDGDEPPRSFKMREREEDRDRNGERGRENNNNISRFVNHSNRRNESVTRSYDGGREMQNLNMRQQQQHQQRGQHPQQERGRRMMISYEEENDRRRRPSSLTPPTNMNNNRSSSSSFLKPSATPSSSTNFSRGRNINYEEEREYRRENERRREDSREIRTRSSGHNNNYSNVQTNNTNRQPSREHGRRNNNDNYPRSRILKNETL